MMPKLDYDNIKGIALLGSGHVGKTTITDQLCRTFQVRRFHPKQLYGEMISPVLLRMGVPLDLIEDYIFGKSIELPLPGHPHLTTRKLLQTIVTGFIEGLKSTTFALDLMAPPGGLPVVIESVRRPKEADELRAHGFAIVYVGRPGFEPNLEHETEQDLSGYPADFVIHNDSDLAYLHWRAAEIARTCGLQERKLTHIAMIINGRPRSGKDSLTDALIRVAQARGMSAEMVSSIDPIRNIMAGHVDVSAKTQADRVLLADVKKAFDAHHRSEHGHGFCTGHLASYINATRKHDSSLFITHIRETENIEELKRIVRCPVQTVWVSRPGTDAVENDHSSDQIIMDDADYIHHIRNDGDLASVDRLAAHLLTRAIANVPTYACGSTI